MTAAPSVAGRVPRGATTVTVGVKAPNGYVLRVFRMKPKRHALPGGRFEQVDEFEAVPGKRHVVYGYAAAVGKQPVVPVRFGYAVNEGVPADVWEGWLEQNRDSDMVLNGLIFALPTFADVEKEALVREKTRDGLEPMQMDVVDANGKILSMDPRAPASIAIGRPDLPGRLVNLPRPAVTEADDSPNKV